MLREIAISPTSSVVLMVLWLLWAALLFGGFLFSGWNAHASRWRPAWTRVGSSLALVLAAWCWALVARSTAAAGFALLIAIGMTLGFMGDLLMGRLLPVTQPVLSGMAAFGLGHVAYIAAALGASSRLGLTDPGPRLLAWTGWLLFGLVSWYFVAFRGKEVGQLNWLALPYALLLASTAGVATGLAMQDARFWLFAIGAALFLISDLILAAALFSDGRRRKHADTVIWLTYGPGQMLIVYGVGSVLVFS